MVAPLLVGAVIAAACSDGDSALDAGNDDADVVETDPTETGADPEPATDTDAPAAEPAPSGDADAAATTDATDDAESVDAGSDGEPTDDATQPDTTVAPEPAGPTTTSVPLAELPACPTGALDTADGPVEITFWHGLGNELEAALIDLVDAYNEGQDRVVVDLQNQVTYESIADKYIQAGVGARPDVVQLPEYTVQAFAQSDTFVPVAACIEAAGYDTSALLPGALTTYVFEGVQWGLPFNVSGPVLYYNRPMFEAAGLDPDDPPVSLEELRAASETLVSSGAAGVGIALDSSRDAGGSWYLEQWLARAGQPYVDNGNGRSAPATEVLFDGEAGVELLTFVQDLVADELAVSVGDNPGGVDTFLKMIDESEPAAMTIGTSAAISSVLGFLGGGAAPGLGPADVGVGPMPGPGEQPSVQVGGASLWIPAGKSDEVTAAAWDFVAHLVEAQTQSTWAAATGYVPVRSDALELDPIRTTYAEDPRFRVAYDQLVAADAEFVSAVPALGPQREVRAQTADAVAAIYAGADVATELAAAADAADALIANYNARN